MRRHTCVKTKPSKLYLIEQWNIVSSNLDHKSVCFFFKFNHVLLWKLRNYNFIPPCLMNLEIVGCMLTTNANKYE